MMSLKSFDDHGTTLETNGQVNGTAQIVIDKDGVEIGEEDRWCLHVSACFA